MYHAPLLLKDIRVDDPNLDSILSQLRKDHRAEIARLRRRTGQSASQWRQWAREERFFSANEALEAGIIDSILFAEVPRP
jgi:ATP-dependent protease ClpP protease subunit